MTTGVPLMGLYPSHERPVGVFDSGIGGLSVLKALRAELPHGNFIYLADSGHAPSGQRDTAQLQARARAITQYLVEQGVHALVIACNTATAAAVDLLREQHPDLPIIGVEPAIKPAVAISKTGRVGVKATRSTLASARFQTLLGAHLAQAPAVSLQFQPCDGLADAIEQNTGKWNATEIIAACASHMRAMGIFGSKKARSTHGCWIARTTRWSARRCRRWSGRR